MNKTQERYQKNAVESVKKAFNYIDVKPVCRKNKVCKDTIQIIITTPQHIIFSSDLKELNKNEDFSYLKYVATDKSIEFHFTYLL